MARQIGAAKAEYVTGTRHREMAAGKSTYGHSARRSGKLMQAIYDYLKSEAIIKAGLVPPA